MIWKLSFAALISATNVASFAQGYVLISILYPFSEPILCMKRTDSFCTAKAEI